MYRVGTYLVSFEGISYCIPTRLRRSSVGSASAYSKKARIQFYALQPREVFPTWERSRRIAAIECIDGGMHEQIPCISKYICPGNLHYPYLYKNFVRILNEHVTPRSLKLDWDEVYRSDPLVWRSPEVKYSKPRDISWFCWNTTWLWKFVTPITSEKSWVRYSLHLINTNFIEERVLIRIGFLHRLNTELNLQSLFELLVHSCTHWLRPRRSPLPPAFGLIYEGAIG
jgi:hypothetical protein